MSTAVALSVDGMNVADAMGFSAPQQKQQSELWRINALVKQGVEAGKIKSTPMFRVRKGDEEVYSEKLSMRLFAERSQWTKWDSEVNNTQKTVLAGNLNGDMKDTLGGFNLGRPTGYIEDFQSLPEATKQIMRSVKRVKVFFGTVTLDNPVNDKGEPVTGNYTDVPVVMDVKNRDSLKSIDAVLNGLNRKNLLPIMSTIKMVGVEDSIPTGAKFGKIEAKLGTAVDLSDADNDILKDFMDLVEYINGKVLDLHNERSNKSMSASDEAVVNDILNNDFIEVE